MGTNFCDYNADFYKKLSLAFNSYCLFEVAQRHDGFRAMPSAAFWSESGTAADRIATDYSGLNTG